MKLIVLEANSKLSHVVFTCKIKSYSDVGWMPEGLPLNALRMLIVTAFHSYICVRQLNSCLDPQQTSHCI